MTTFLDLVERLVLAAERIADHVAPKKPEPKHSRFSIATNESFELGERDRQRRISVEEEEEARRAAESRTQ